MTLSQPKTDRTRRAAWALDSKYKTGNGQENRYFHSKREAAASAKRQSCFGTVVLCQRNVTGDGWIVMDSYRFGKKVGA